MLQFAEIMKRADFHQISNFIVNDCGEDYTDNLTFKEKLDQLHHDLFELLKDRLPYDKYNDDLKDQIYLTLGDYADIYMKIGMKAGVKLLFQLLSEKE